MSTFDLLTYCSSSSRVKSEKLSIELSLQPERQGRQAGWLAGWQEGRMSEAYRSSLEKCNKQIISTTIISKRKMIIFVKSIGLYGLVGGPTAEQMGSSQQNKVYVYRKLSFWVIVFSGSKLG